MDTKTLLELGYSDLNVQLTQSRDQHLVSLCIAADVERRILVLKACQRRADLLLVAPALGFDCEGYRRLGVLDVIDKNLDVSFGLKHLLERV